MIARITVIDGDGKEILTEERKVWEEPRITEDGFRYTDCCVKLRFSIAETEEERRRREFEDDTPDGCNNTGNSPNCNSD